MNVRDNDTRPSSNLLIRSTVCAFFFKIFADIALWLPFLEVRIIRETYRCAILSISVPNFVDSDSGKDHVLGIPRQAGHTQNCLGFMELTN
jgi:hypothetical protein